jgi:hypothetical protein
MTASTASDDPFAGLFGPENPDQVRQSLLAAQAVCEEKHQFYENTKKYIDEHPSVKAFRTVETAFFAVFHFGTENRAIFLVIMVVIAAITATVGKHHIGLRPAVTRTDYIVHDLAMILGNALLAYSSISYILSLSHSGVAVDLKSSAINYLWAILFVVLTLISAYRLIRPAAPKREGGSIGLALLSVPLYAQMAILTGIAFIFFMDYSVGQAIYLGGYAADANSCDGLVPEHFASVEFLARNPNLADSDCCRDSNRLYRCVRYFRGGRRCDHL